MNGSAPVIFVKVASVDQVDKKFVEASIAIVLEAGRYHGPLRKCLPSVFPFLENEAEEILQDFSQDKLLIAGWLCRADRPVAVSVIS